LNREGFPVNRKRVQRLMRLMGLESVAPKPNTSKHRKEHKVYPYLLKKMSITDPDQVWCSDITYIRMPHGLCIFDSNNGLGEPLCVVLENISNHE
jgi:putative transposase